MIGVDEYLGVEPVELIGVELVELIGVEGLKYFGVEFSILFLSTNGHFAINCSQSEIDSRRSVV